MKHFLLGFFAAVLFVILAVGGLFLYLRQEAIQRSNDFWEQSWSEQKNTEVRLTLYPSTEIDLSHALGMDAHDLSRFLARGNAKKENQFLKVFGSGLDITIHADSSKVNNTTQTVYFRDGKMERSIRSVNSDVKLLRDPSAEVNIKGQVDLDEQIRELQDLRVRAEAQQNSIKTLEPTAPSE